MSSQSKRSEIAQVTKNLDETLKRIEAMGKPNKDNHSEYAVLARQALDLSSRVPKIVSEFITKFAGHK